MYAIPSFNETDFYILTKMNSKLFFLGSQINGEKQIRKEGSRPLLHSLSGHIFPRRAEPKPEAKSFFQVPTELQSLKALSRPLVHSQVTSRELEGKGNSWDTSWHPWDAGACKTSTLATRLPLGAQDTKCYPRIHIISYLTTTLDTLSSLCKITSNGSDVGHTDTSLG